MFGLSGTINLAYQEPFRLIFRLALSEPKFGPFGTQVWPFRNPVGSFLFLDHAVKADFLARNTTP